MIEVMTMTLDTLNLSVTDKEKVKRIIQNQVAIHKYCNKDISNVMLYIVGKKVEGVDCIKVFDRNTVIVETLDTSYTRMRNLVTLEDWNTNFILKVTFQNESVQLEPCKIQDMPPVVFKKVKALTYGVTDGNNIAKIDVLQQDIKGLEYNTLKDIVNYSFYHKLKGKLKTKVQNLTYVVVEYE